MISHEEYVSLNTAKLLKQAGFNWETINYYHECGELRTGLHAENFNKYHSQEFPNTIEAYSAPTQAVAMRWLREVKNCILELYFSTYIDKYTIKIIRPRIIKDVRSFKIDDNDQFYETYEQAAEAGIQECLKLILEEKKRLHTN